jgi:hypothetical protein
VLLVSDEWSEVGSRASVVHVRLVPQAGYLPFQQSDVALQVLGALFEAANTVVQQPEQHHQRQCKENEQIAHGRSFK